MNDLAESMGVHRRTVLRWAGLLDALHVRDSPTERVLRETGDDGRTWLCLEHPMEPDPGATPYQAAAALLAVQGLAGAGGSLLSDCAADVLSGDDTDKRLRRGFHVQAHEPRGYRVHDGTLDLVLRAVVQRRRLTFQRRGLPEDSELRTYEPWTLVAYKGALYLYGLDIGRGEMRTWAVERMDGVVLTEARFEVPEDYDPAKVFGDSFGIWTEQPAADDIVAVFSERVWSAVAARVIPGEVSLDATSRTMTWRTPITPEVVTWFVGWAGEAEVLAPSHLRERVAGAHRAAMAVYVKDGSGEPKPQVEEG